jgi:hypothetical protein
MKLATRIVIVSALVLAAGEAFAAGSPSFGGARGHLVVGNLGQTHNGPTQNTPIVTLPPVVRPPAIRPH